MLMRVIFDRKRAYAVLNRILKAENAKRTRLGSQWGSGGRDEVLFLEQVSRCAQVLIWRLGAALRAAENRVKGVVFCRLPVTVGFVSLAWH